MSTIQDFLQFATDVPSPYTVVDKLVAHLNTVGARDLWAHSTRLTVEKGVPLYAVIGGKTIIAIFIPKDVTDLPRIALALAHTDSPTLHLRSNPLVQDKAFGILGVGTYGGGLWHTWFDRGLGCGGQIVVKSRETSRSVSLKKRSVVLSRPIAIIPSLAIHLKNAEERKKLEVNPETQLRPFCAAADALCQAEEFTTTLLNCLKEENTFDGTPETVEFDLCLYDCVPPRVVGVKSDLVESPKLDNLTSVWAIFKGFTETAALAMNDASLSSNTIIVAAAFDSEEVGSMTSYGAMSQTLSQYLDLILESVECLTPSKKLQVMRHSFCVSADAAHGFHPNYPDKYQKENAPLINQGLVLKMNPNQRYCTSTEAATIFQTIMDVAGIRPRLQPFVVRNDTPCGSTIGPMVTSLLGIQGVDIGVPVLAMHSIRETGGAKDIVLLAQAMAAFFQNLERGKLGPKMAHRSVVEVTH